MFDQYFHQTHQGALVPDRWQSHYQLPRVFFYHHEELSDQWQLFSRFLLPGNS